MTKQLYIFVTRMAKLCFAVIVWIYSVPAVGQQKENGINIGITYPLSIQCTRAKEYSNIFSVHAFFGYSREEKAFAVSGFANNIREGARGFVVAGFLNRVGGSAEGFQAAGFVNTYAHAEGFQAAGFANISRGHVRGMQVSGFINRAHNLRGMQAAGFMNIADDVTGTQVAGFINKAKKVKGAQIAGFINIADSSEYPIGIINLISNGEKFMGVTTDDNSTTVVAFRSGSKRLYGIIGLGYNFRNKKEVLAFQYGLGAHLMRRNAFRINVEGTVTQLESFRRGDYTKTSLVVMPAVRVAKKLEVFAGPSLNYVSTTSSDGHQLIDHYWWNRNHDNREYGMYIGYTAGIHYAW